MISVDPPRPLLPMNSVDPPRQPPSSIKDSVDHLVAEVQVDHAVAEVQKAVEKGAIQASTALASVASPCRRRKFEELPNTVACAVGVEKLHPLDVDSLVRRGQCVLVDVRGPDRSSGFIEGSVHEEFLAVLGKIPELVQRWARQPLVIFHCQYSCHRAPQSANLYRALAPLGQHVAIMSGGFRGWESCGLPVVQMQAGLGVAHWDAYAKQQGMYMAVRQ